MVIGAATVLEHSRDRAQPVAQELAETAVAEEAAVERNQERLDVAGADTLIAGFTFEDGVLPGETSEAEEPGELTPLFSDGLETGELGAWASSS
jgi:hypothetical protein